MATIQERIHENLKEAMKQKDALRLSVLRMLSSAFQSKQIEKRAKIGDQSVELSEEEVSAVLRHEAKKRIESEAQFSAAGRTELARKEKEELEVIKEYLPEEIDDAAIEAVVREVCASMDGTTEKNFGKIMAAVMKKTGGRASGDRVSAIVKKHFRTAQ